MEYLLGTEAAGAIGALLRLPDADVHVPALCDIEVASGLRHALLRELLTAERAEMALGHYLLMPLARHGHRTDLPRVLELRANFSAYDACYVTLAERLGADLLTADARLARAASAHTDIRVLP